MFAFLVFILIISNITVTIDHYKQSLASTKTNNPKFQKNTPCLTTCSTIDFAKYKFCKLPISQLVNLSS